MEITKRNIVITTANKIKNKIPHSIKKKIDKNLMQLLLIFLSIWCFSFYFKHNENLWDLVGGFGVNLITLFFAIYFVESYLKIFKEELRSKREKKERRRKFRHRKIRLSKSY